MVHGSADTKGFPTVRGLCEGEGIAAPGVEDTVCRLRNVAARVAAGGGAGAATGLLAQATGWAGGAGVANGLAASRGAEPGRGSGCGASRAGVGETAA